MNWLKWLAEKIAELGQSIQFVAFCAHLGVTALLVENLPGNGEVWCWGFLGFAVVKEYWFDARYEHNPPQTFWDNTEDFLGYAVGAVLGLGLRP